MSPAQQRAAGLPLQELGVAITRAEPPGGPLERRLARLGARVLRWNAVSIAPPADPAPLDRAAASLASYDWVVFASSRAVAALAAAATAPAAVTPFVGALAGGAAAGDASPPAERLPGGPTQPFVAGQSGLHPDHPSWPRVAVVGPATAAAAERAGWRVDRLPAELSAAGLVESFRSAGDAPGARILLPASAQGRPELAAGLAALGATVAAVEAYRTLPSALDGAACRAALAAGEVDAITFTSPSAVSGLERALGPADFAAALSGRLVVSIGPTTTRALSERGRAPDAEARPSTLDGLVEALIGSLPRGLDRAPNT